MVRLKTSVLDNPQGRCGVVESNPSDRDRMRPRVRGRGRPRYTVLRAILKFMALPDFTPRVGNDPKSVVIHLTTGTGMEIEWKDGHRSVYTFAFLREACPCALCEDERGKSGRKAGVAAKPVGKYALRFSWNDKHDLGIYSWFYLRDVCPCAECAAARG